MPKLVSMETLTRFRQSMFVKLIAAMALFFMLLLTVNDATSSPSRAMPKQSSASALYKDECGSCHLAFAPSLARTEDWLRITSSLSRHFGSDASVSPQSLAMLETYFKTYGSNREKYKFAPGSLRISDSPWFQRKHRKQRLAEAIGIRTISIRAWSDCMQCHAQADKGYFDDDDEDDKRR